MTIINRQRILDAWRSDPQLPLRTLAERLGVSLGCVTYHVAILEQCGLITGRNHEVGNRTGKYTRHMAADELSKVRRAAACKPRKKGDVGLQARLDRVVQKALQVAICPPSSAERRKPYQMFVEFKRRNNEHNR